MLLVDDLVAGGTKNLRHTPRGLVTLKVGYCDFCVVRLQQLLQRTLPKLVAGFEQTWHK